MYKIMCITSERFDNTTLEGMLVHSPSKIKTNAANELRKAEGHMLNETKTALNDFFRPFNIILAEILKDKDFIWNSL